MAFDQLAEGVRVTADMGGEQFGVVRRPGYGLVHRGTLPQSPAQPLSFTSVIACLYPEPLY